MPEDAPWEYDSEVAPEESGSWSERFLKGLGRQGTFGQVPTEDEVRRMSEEHIPEAITVAAAGSLLAPGVLPFLPRAAGAVAGGVEGGKRAGPLGAVGGAVLGAVKPDATLTGTGLIEGGQDIIEGRPGLGAAEIAGSMLLGGRMGKILKYLRGARGGEEAAQAGAEIAKGVQAARRTAEVAKALPAEKQAVLEAARAAREAKAAEAVAQARTARPAATPPDQIEEALRASLKPAARPGAMTLGGTAGKGSVEEIAGQVGNWKTKQGFSDDQIFEALRNVYGIPAKDGRQILQLVLGS